MIGITAIDRFEMQYIPVTESGCWLWTGSPEKDGYGRMRVNGKRPKAHRYSYETFVGEIPKGMSVLHKCDVSCCVNPNHLFVGTHEDNMKDQKNKGRTLYGEKGTNVKLKEADVYNILSAIKNGEPQLKIANRFGISQASVSLIKTGKNWPHIHRTLQN